MDSIEPHNEEGEAPQETLSNGPSGLVLIVLIGLGAGLLMAAMVVFGGDSLDAFSSLLSGGEGVPVLVDEPAPDVSGIALSGEPVSLSGYDGQVILVNFWATWCGPCEAEMPALQAAYEAHQDEGFVVLTINAGESASTVRSYLAERGLTFPAWLDIDGTLADQFAVQYFPTSYWIDRDGVVRYRHLGIMTESTIETYIDELLGDTG